MSAYESQIEARVCRFKELATPRQVSGSCSEGSFSELRRAICIILKVRISKYLEKVAKYHEVGFLIGGRHEK